MPAVETLGSTSAICSDKTGTLTLNKMTARELVIPGPGNVFKISGEGYGTAGEITRAGGMNLDLDPFLLPMVLCADASLDGEELIGDPTEGALIVLGAKGGLDIEQTRATYPRIAEVPFDSEYKFMATFHNMTNADGKPVVRAYVKGAPDVLISRGSKFWTAEGAEVAAADEQRNRALSENDRLAGSGQRVMVVAQRDFDPGTFDPQAKLIDSMNDLTLAGDGWHRRSPTSGSEGRHRGMQERRHPGSHDHRRPCHDRGRHWQRAGNPWESAHRSAVLGHVR